MGSTHQPLFDADYDGITLLAVWAHPDDEAYLGAGLMHAVSSGGGRVVSVTATLGEHGTDDPAACPPDRLGRLRHRELERSLQVLGAGAPVVLGYADGDCDRVPDRLGASRVASLIDEHRPQVVLSFGRDGVTGHPDHQAVGRWTELAVAAQAHQPALFTTAAASAWPDDLVQRMHRIGAFFPGFPDDAARVGDVPAVLDEFALDTKLAALRSHRSQIGPMESVLGPSGYSRLAAAEAYRPANHAAWAWLGAEPVTRSA